MSPSVTTCTFDCPDRCSVLCSRADGRLSLRGDPDHPYTQGFTCAKIRRHPQRLTSPHRIREPWVRHDGQFRPASWEEAMVVTAGALEAALAEDPASVLWVRGSGNQGVSKGFTDYVFRCLGARGTRGGLCDQAGIAAITADAGALDMNDPEEIDRAEAIVLWGKNPRASSVHLAAQVVRARRRGVPVFAVNPDLDEVADLADQTLLVRPGSDRFLALACARLLREADGLRNQPEEAASAENFSRALDSLSTAEMLEACGVEREGAEKLVALYRRTPRVATVLGWGVQRYRHGGATVRAIHALCFLAGTLGVRGGGLYYNISSSRHLQRPRPDQAEPAPLLLPHLALEVERASPRPRFAWFTCSNYLNQAPDAKRAGAALSGIDTVVTVDAFWTETARHSHVVLPSTLWLEEDDLVGSYWRNVLCAARRVVEPPEGCRSDFEVLLDLAARVGLDLPFSTADDWLRACLPPSGPSLDHIRASGWVRIDHPSPAWQEGFAHPDGRFRLLSELPPPPAGDPQHPYRLISGISRRAIHSQILPEDQTRPLPVRVHPETAARHDLAPGDGVRVVSSAGEVEAELHCDPRVHPDAVCCRRGGWISLGVGANELTTDQLTDLGETAAYYDTRVRLERAGGPRLI